MEGDKYMNANEHELLTALRTIAALQANDRLDTTGAKLQIQKPSMYNSFMRTFIWPQSRDTCIDRIRSVVDSAINTADGYRQRASLQSTDMRVLQLLAAGMTDAALGLKHLADTYTGTAAGTGISLFATNLDLCHDRLHAFLEKWHRKKQPAGGRHHVGKPTRVRAGTTARAASCARTSPVAITDQHHQNKQVVVGIHAGHVGSASHVGPAAPITRQVVESDVVVVVDDYSEERWDDDDEDGDEDEDNACGVNNTSKTIGTNTGKTGANSGCKADEKRQTEDRVEDEEHEEGDEEEDEEEDDDDDEYVDM